MRVHTVLIISEGEYVGRTFPWGYDTCLPLNIALEHILFLQVMQVVLLRETSLRILQ